MNKIYKSIWSVSKGTYVAVSELARGKGKSSSCGLGGSQKTGCAARSYLQSNSAGKHTGAWAENYLPLSFRLSQLAVLISLGGIAGSAMAAAPIGGSGNGLSISTRNCSGANAQILESIAIGCGANAPSIEATSIVDRKNPYEVRKRPVNPS
ncbi:ESPR domain-containing protein [Advenella incenata]|uniref:ESPR domain-containing protein n=1 Tax=Advenella incenata TaxID=267800 RepID=UPI001029FABD|nr:ESPR-type extended signal peptide-containing protein [Advenella incenata]